MGTESKRNEKAARAFAIKWSTSSLDGVANLSACYLRATATLDALRVWLRKEGHETCECAACRWAFRGEVPGG